VRTSAHQRNSGQVVGLLRWRKFIILYLQTCTAGARCERENKVTRPSNAFWCAAGPVQPRGTESDVARRPAAYALPFGRQAGASARDGMRSTRRNAAHHGTSNAELRSGWWRSWARQAPDHTEGARSGLIIPGARRRVVLFRVDFGIGDVCVVPAPRQPAKSDRERRLRCFLRAAMRCYPPSRFAHNSLALVAKCINLHAR
jgi:hypothetical protein